MFAILCRGRRSRVLPTDCIFTGQKFRVLTESFSSGICSASVCENASEKSFTVSYLVNSCGLSSNDAISVSKKASIKSPQRTDAVLKLLREYGFTDVHIPRIVTRWPDVLSACPEKNLSPKLEYLQSIGIPLPVLAENLSVYPFVLRRSLKNSIIPVRDKLKALLQSDEGVVHVFSCAPIAFSRACPKETFPSISLLRERGVPEQTIASLLRWEPSFLITNKGKLRAYADRAIEMGFDVSKSAFIQAIRVFISLSESSLEHKMEIYRRCGWSESDIIGAFLRYPFCLKYSEAKIMASMDFLVRELGCKPSEVAQTPKLVGFSLEKRMRPRCRIARILSEKGLKSMAKVSTTTLLSFPEKMFLHRYITKYEKDVPELLEIYRGKMSPPENGFEANDGESRVQKAFVF